jgi:hypothetical protein
MAETGMKAWLEYMGSTQRWRDYRPIRPWSRQHGGDGLPHAIARLLVGQIRLLRDWIRERVCRIGGTL